MLKGAVTAILLFFVLNISAQVYPPEIDCIRNDTVFWTNPVNSCGPFSNYQLYFSNDHDGPYSLLVSIGSETQDFYYHSGAAGQSFCYYMASDYICPGEPSLLSDTICSSPIPHIEINSVSVDNGDIHIDWDPSPDPRVIYYVVYRTTSVGTLPIDTVFSGSEYTDTGASPDGGAESYYIIAVDACGNGSIFDNPHFSIFLEEETNQCEQLLNLSWSSYMGWGSDLAKYEILVSENSGLEAIVDTVSANENQYELLGITNTNEYCVTVRAIHSNSMFSARSNTICLTPDVVNKMEYIAIQSATWTEDNEIAINWFWNDDADISNFQLLRISIPEIVVHDQNPTLPIDPNAGLIDSNPFPVAQNIYQIASTDLCDSIFRSDTVKTIKLFGAKQSNDDHYLVWKPYEFPLATINRYDLFRISDSGPEFITTTTPDINNYLDPFTSEFIYNGSTCYFVIADGVVDIPEVGSLSFSTRSNDFCFFTESNIFVPNAIAPLGVNTVFRPQIPTQDFLTSYDLRVFNRWGEEVFHSSDINEGWEGTLDGELAPQGVYVYTITIGLPDNTKKTQKGSFMVIY
jgi:gliding motility-associated-like protein